MLGRIARVGVRALSTSRAAMEPARPSIQAIAELRRQVPGTSLIKAREALVASREASAPDTDSVPAAVAWLEENRKEEGCLLYTSDAADE